MENIMRPSISRHPRITCDEAWDHMSICRRACRSVPTSEVCECPRRVNNAEEGLVGFPST